MRADSGFGAVTWLQPRNQNEQHHLQLIESYFLTAPAPADSGCSKGAASGGRCHEFFRFSKLNIEHLKTDSILGISQIGVKVNKDTLSIANTFSYHRLSL